MLLFDFSDTSGAIRHWVLCQSIKVEGQQPLGTWVLFRLCWLPQGETGGVLAASQCLFSTPFSQPPYCISSTVCRAEPGCSPLSQICPQPDCCLWPPYVTSLLQTWAPAPLVLLPALISWPASQLPLASERAASQMLPLWCHCTLS